MDEKKVKIQTEIFKNLIDGKSYLLKVGHDRSQSVRNAVVKFNKGSELKYKVMKHQEGFLIYPVPTVDLANKNC